MRYRGLGLYTALTSTTGHDILLEVDNFIEAKTSIPFTSTMLIVAQWMNVCPYNNRLCSTDEVHNVYRPYYDSDIYYIIV